MIVIEIRIWWLSFQVVWNKPKAKDKGHQ